MEATYTTSPSFAITGRTVLFVDEYVFAQSPHANYDVSLDGNKLVVIRSTESAKVVVAYRRARELRARMAGLR